MSGSPRPFFPWQDFRAPGALALVSGARVPALILSPGASVSESRHQTQRKRDVACDGKGWRGSCAHSRTFLVSPGRILQKASLVTGMGDELGLIFKSGRQQKEVSVPGGL